MKSNLVFTVLLLAVFSCMNVGANGCICLAVYRPVCATNGVTYGNSCEMRCAGAKLKHVGDCDSDLSYVVV